MIIFSSTDKSIFGTCGHFSWNLKHTYLKMESKHTSAPYIWVPYEPNSHNINGITMIFTHHDVYSQGLPVFDCSVQTLAKLFPGCMQCLIQVCLCLSADSESASPCRSSLLSAMQEIGALGNPVRSWGICLFCAVNTQLFFPSCTLHRLPGAAWDRFACLLKCSLTLHARFHHFALCPFIICLQITPYLVITYRNWKSEEKRC